MSVVVRIDNVSKSYRLGVLDRRALWQDIRSKFAGPSGDKDRTFWSLKDISFDVKDGEVVGLLGHNGAGKSTLLKILSNITTPTSGRVFLRGRIASLLEVGPGFHPELTGRDNVYVKGAILGMTRREVTSKFDEIVDFAGVEAFIDTPVKRYSVGMRVRLAFAIAAHLEPEILLVDEVLAVGDAVFQQRCLGKINEVAHSGRTVFFVSHNAAVIESLCTRGVVLEQGKVVFDGSQTEAVEFYASRRVSKGNDLRGRTDRTGSGDVQLTTIDVCNSRGTPVPVARAGEDIEIHMQFERRSKRDFPRISVQLFVTTHLGTPVFTQANWLEGEYFGSLPERGKIRCRIPKLPLPVGHYRIGYRLQPEMRAKDTPLDVIENAAELYVESGTFFSSGQLPPLQAGMCLVAAEWSLEQAEESHDDPVLKSAVNL